ncbi:hypothetical protein AUR64_14155 [Haloprofundus marisrubri]|uniref:DUF4112 domain-containing protein n=1 Tax=Haloprofundus marisrubri TaxID=1514971 RepID=A0A0W1R7G6_9EURY|nr:DUF4112 domain-containing protein [Haloprofundus marisrubri]KTG08948.1 hypothetical protein AUR64_14155 [Haloprofundus marisrubri]
MTDPAETRPGAVERANEESDTTSAARVAEHAETLQRLHRLGRLLDNSIRIPGTNYRIGLDPIVGLIPVVGDVPITAVSAYIVAEAAYLGVPKVTVLRMLFNLVVDALVGSIPVVGDLFDAVWKANARNVRLAEARRGDPRAEELDRRFFTLVVGGLFVLLLALGTASTLAVLWLVGRLV